MKKSILYLAALVVLSASTFIASAQVRSQAVSGANPRPQAVSGCNPRPQSVLGGVFTAIFAYFGY